MERNMDFIEELKERFLRYVAFDTQSDPESETFPSTAKQLALLNRLVEEMISLGMTEVEIDPNSYVTGTVPATPGCESKPVIGFIAHVDTSPDMKGADIRPRLIERYDGGDIPLNDSLSMRVKDFPELSFFKGHTLIVTDGTTLLGADDKAGVAEIMTALERIIAENRPHGKLCIGFTPDEEIGEGASLFDVPGFGAAYAYTVDGEDVGEISYENFNAAAAVVTVHGFSVHPGSAKDTMINAQNVAMEFHAALPAFSRPEHTEGREGFFHLTSMQGDVTTAHLGYIVRDHDAAKFAARKAQLQHIADCLNGRYGAGTVELDIKDSYYNMLEKIQPHFHLVENARKAIRAAGLEPIESPVRGGTDGATLSYMGLPCPNLGTGGFNFHGPCECITAEKMDQGVEILLNLVDLYK